MNTLRLEIKEGLLKLQRSEIRQGSPTSLIGERHPNHMQIDEGIFNKS